MNQKKSNIFGKKNVLALFKNKLMQIILMNINEVDGKKGTKLTGSGKSFCSYLRLKQQLRLIFYIVTRRLHNSGSLRVQTVSKKTCEIGHV